MQKKQNSFGEYGNLRKDPSNKRPIMCLPITCKILNAKIEEIYYSLLCNGHFPERQKENGKGTK